MTKLLLVSLLLFASLARAEDHRSQWSAGGGLGANVPAPWAKSNFTNTVDLKLPHAAGWVRYNQGSPEVSLELSYHYLTLAKQNVYTHAVIFQWISRILPDSIIHPQFGFGIGWSRSENYYQTGSWDTPIFQLRAGLDYELRPDLDLSLYLDHFSVFRNSPGEPNMHVLAPTIALTKYFGTSLKLPREEKAREPEAAPSAPSPSSPASPPAEGTESIAQPKAEKKTSATKATKKKKKRRKGPHRLENGSP